MHFPCAFCIFTTITAVCAVPIVMGSGLASMAMCQPGREEPDYGA
jgi:hypothetical protein